METQVEVGNIFINDLGKKCRNLLTMFAVDELERLCYENQNIVQKAVDEHESDKSEMTV